MLKALLFLCLPGSLLAAEMRDVVTMKDGSVVKGVILEQIPGKTIKLQTADESVYVYPMDGIAKMSREELKEAKEPEEIGPAPQPAPRARFYRRRAPGAAWFLSALYPGIGQYYNGDAVKGVAMQLFYTGAWITALNFGTSYNTRQETASSTYYDYTYDYGCYCYTYVPTTYTYTRTVQDPYLNSTFYVSLGVAVAVSLWSQMDAPVRSAQKNREARQYGHLMEWDGRALALGLDLDATADGRASSRLSLHF